MQETVSKQNTEVQPEVKIRRPKKPWVGITLAVVICILGIIIFARGNEQIAGKPFFASLPETSTVSPTPFPFQELTVPYLRGRTYKSSLSELELLSEHGNYTSYLASYDSEGMRVNGLLTIPKGALQDYGWPASNASRSDAGWPAIVFIHGYIPPTQYQTTQQYADYVDYLARNGFVVFKIDLRGHGDSEGEPGGGYYGSDYIVDTLNAYAALQKVSFIDPDGIGLWGHSMAGNIVLRSMVAKPDIPAVVIWAGAVYSYVDQRIYGINDNSYQPPLSGNTQRLNRRRALFEKYGSPSAESVFWQQVAPTNYLTDLKGAIEIHHSVDDAVVDIGYSRDLMDLLDKTSVQHALHEYSSGGHNITGGSFIQAMEGTVAFFKTHLNRN